MRYVLFVALLTLSMSISANAQSTEQTNDAPAAVDTVTALAYSSDGATIASGNNNGFITLFDVDSGAIVDSLFGRADDVRDLSFHPGGTYLASANSDGIRVWNLDTGDVNHIRWTPPGEEEDLAFSRVRFSNDGSLLVAGTMHGVIVVWDGESFVEQRAWRAHGTFINDLGLSQDGRVLATSSFSPNVKIWDATTGESLASYEGTEGGLVKNVTAIGVHPDGSYVLDMSADGRLFTYRMQGGVVQHLKVPNQIGYMRFSGGGQQVAMTLNTSDGPNLLTMDFTGQTHRAIIAHHEQPRGLAMHPSKAWAATSAIDGSIKIWDLVTGDQIKAIGPNRLRDLPLTERTAGVVMAEDFDDNHNSWGERSAADAYYVVRDGVLHYQRKTSSFFNWIERTFDGDRDFRIETGVTHLAGIKNHSHNLVFGGKDGKSYFRFGISANGSFQIERKIDSESESLAKWTKSAAIQTDGTVNRLAVEQRGQMWSFSINDVVVHESAAQAFPGSKVGVIVFGEQTVAYDYIVITQPGNGPIAPAYERPAATDGPITLFDEQFDDNTNDWPLEQEGTKLRLSDGIYRIDRAKGAGNYIVLRGSADLSEEFTIEARLRKDKGDDDKVWVGLVWGFASFADYANILIRPNGKYSLAVSDHGDYRRILEWKEARVLEKKSKWNTVPIERRVRQFKLLDQRLKDMSSYTTRFWLNDKLVTSYDDWPAPYGNRLGLRVTQGSRVEYDYLTVTRP